MLSTPPQTIDTNGQSLRQSSDIQQAIATASEDWWFSGAMLAFGQLAASGRGFTLDDVRGLGVGDPPSPAYWGALVAASLRTGSVVTVGCKVLRDGRLGRVFWGAQ